MVLCSGGVGSIFFSLPCSKHRKKVTKLSDMVVFNFTVIKLATLAKIQILALIFFFLVRIQIFFMNHNL